MMLFNDIFVCVLYVNCAVIPPGKVYLKLVILHIILAETYERNTKAGPEVCTQLLRVFIETGTISGNIVG
jgi:hypothetical protein